MNQVHVLQSFLLLKTAPLIPFYLLWIALEVLHLDLYSLTVLFEGQLILCVALMNHYFCTCFVHLIKKNMLCSSAAIWCLISTVNALWWVACLEQFLCIWLFSQSMHSYDVETSRGHPSLAPCWKQSCWTLCNGVFYFLTSNGFQNPINHTNSFHHCSHLDCKHCITLDCTMCVRAFF